MPKKITIRGFIGISENATPQFLENELSAANGGEIDLEFSSGGGFVFPGLEMANMVRNYSGKVVAKITGLAASMSSYIPMMADEVIVEDNAVFMIHNVSGFAMGDFREVEKAAKHLEALRNVLAKAYVAKTGKSLEEVQDLMDDESFYYGSEIVDDGFADGMVKSKSDDDKDRDTAVALAQAEIKDCIAQMKASEVNVNDDFERAAAFIGGTEPENPFQNEHACRVREPSDFKKDSFRRISRTSDGKKLDIIIGKLKGKTTTTTQAYRYPKNEWTEAQAKKHCRDHDGLSFEPAGNADYNNPPVKAGKPKEEASIMNFTELMAANPDAKAEFDVKIASARAEGETAGKETMEKAFTAAIPILSSDSYPETVKVRVTAKAVAGDIEGLKDFVAIHDMNVEANKGGDADGEDGDETPPAASTNLSDDGTVSNPDQLASAVAQHKAQYSTGGTA